MDGLTHGIPPGGPGFLAVFLTHEPTVVLQDVASRLQLAKCNPLSFVRTTEVDPVVEKPEPKGRPLVCKVAGDPFDDGSKDLIAVGRVQDLGKGDMNLLSTLRAWALRRVTGGDAQLRGVGSQP